MTDLNGIGEASGIIRRGILMRTLAAAFFVSLSCLGAANGGPIGGSDFYVGNWSGAAYTSDTTGNFSHCAVSAAFQSGDSLHFSVNRQATVTVGISSLSLATMAEGQQFPVALFVDQREPFYGRATMFLSDFAGVEIPEFAKAMEAFKKGYVLRIEGAGREGVYDLAGSFRALEQARSCAQRYFNFAEAPVAPSAPADADKTVLFQVATEIITALQVPDFRYLTASEVSDRGLPPPGVFWESAGSGMMGGVIVLPRDDLADLRTTDADDAQYFTQSCNGDFASSARDVPEAVVPARELRIICKSEHEPHEIFVSKMLAESTVLYTLLKFSEGANTASPPERAEQNDTATLKAASFVHE